MHGGVGGLPQQASMDAYPPPHSHRGLTPQHSVDGTYGTVGEPTYGTTRHRGSDPRDTGESLYHSRGNLSAVSQPDLEAMYHSRGNLAQPRDPDREPPYVSRASLHASRHSLHASRASLGTPI